MLSCDSSAGQRKLHCGSGHVHLIVENFVGIFSCGIEVLDDASVFFQHLEGIIGFTPPKVPMVTG